MEDKTNVSNRGVVVSVRGSLVDARFDAHLPPIYSVLRTGDKGQIIIEVLAQLDAHHVRGIALTPTQGLTRGMAVQDTGSPLKALMGKGILARMFDMFGNTIDRGVPPSQHFLRHRRTLPRHEGCRICRLKMKSKMYKIPMCIDSARRVPGPAER